MEVNHTGIRSVGVEEAARVLAEGGLVAHPTSTVYGIGGRPTPALDREIARLKGRGEPGPLIRLAGSVGAIRSEAADGWSPEAEALAGRFWPGPLTLVLRLGGEDAGEGVEGVAVRVDSHPVLAALLERAGGWMTSTSLNLHGAPPARTTDEAVATVATFGAARVPLVLLEGGALEGSPPSTIVSLLGERPEILRVGAVPAEAIERVIRGGP